MVTSPADCPVISAHRRFMDCHSQWHAASVTYMEPDGFRLHLNSLVQNLRNVSWLLQKQKSELPSFADWYQPWQDASRADPVMRWVVKARNRVVKESDLEINSTARLTVISSFWKRSEETFSVPPHLTTRRFAHTMLRGLLRDGVRPKEEVLSIERRWVDSALPEWEVLAACTHAMDNLRVLLRTAHEQSGGEECSLPARSLPCVNASLDSESLVCLSDDQEFRRADVSLLTFDELVREIHTIEYDSEQAEVAVQRYGQGTPIQFRTGPIRAAPLVFEQGKHLLTTDGYHVGILWLFRGNEPVSMQGLHFADQVSKYVTMEAIGRQAAQLRSDGFLCVSENWIASAPPDEDWSDIHKIIPARVRPDRMEALHVVAMTAYGEGVEYLNIFTRGPEGDIRLGEDIHTPSLEREGGLFEPVMRHWESTTSHAIDEPDA
jgi:hypothetical protein